MIWNIDTNTEIARIPHRESYDTWIARLSDEQIELIRDEIRGRIGGDTIATAGWIPGADWSGTPFAPIHEVACAHNQEAAAKFFGLLVWTTLQADERRWAFGRYELNNLPLASMTYFQV